MVIRAYMHTHNKYLRSKPEVHGSKRLLQEALKVHTNNKMEMLISQWQRRQEEVHLSPVEGPQGKGCKSLGMEPWAQALILHFLKIEQKELRQGTKVELRAFSFPTYNSTPTILVPLPGVKGKWTAISHCVWANFIREACFVAEQIASLLDTTGKRIQH